MFHISEIKAKTRNIDDLRIKLERLSPKKIGTDHQIDTYFNVSHGRLKWRRGNIENNLIHYHRENKKGPKKSEVTLYKTQPDDQLYTILQNALGILAVVDKKREIYFLDNIKIHLDTVKDLGNFMEIEAIDKDGHYSIAELEQQCRDLMNTLEVSEADLIQCSYSDLIINHTS